ncbi:MAG: ornithine carbamoyltransferase [Desulfovibrionales bacterium]|nr:ornithine carbamoyltransferase [Desulfovibrionales bacterium]
MVRHFLRIPDIPRLEAAQLVLRARQLKKGKLRPQILAGKTAAMIFEKSSTRTRVSFEVAVRHLGGYPLFMTQADSQLGRGEPLKDTARVLSRYTDAIIVRTFEQQKLVELAQYAAIPVINALSDSYHPCQVMSDVLTMFENEPDLRGARVAWIGDGNNMCHSLINAAAYFPFTLAVATPEGYEPDAGVVAEAESLGARLEIGHDPEAAAKGARFIHTDVWASMGQESEQAGREAVFAPYQVDARLMALAADNVQFMHCLPAHRGEEVTEEIFESKASIVFDQAENRLHMQKAILEWALQGIDVEEDAVERLVNHIPLS